jgi:hypothetical protein
MAKIIPYPTSTPDDCLRLASSLLRLAKFSYFAQLPEVTENDAAAIASVTTKEYEMAKERLKYVKKNDLSKVAGLIGQILVNEGKSAATDWETFEVQLRCVLAQLRNLEIFLDEGKLAAAIQKE